MIGIEIPETTQQAIHRLCHSSRENPHGFEHRDAGDAIAWAEQQDGIGADANNILRAYCGSMEDNSECPH